MHPNALEAQEEFLDSVDFIEEAKERLRAFPLEMLEDKAWLESLPIEGNPDILVGTRILIVDSDGSSPTEVFTETVQGLVTDNDTRCQDGIRLVWGECPDNSWSVSENTYIGWQYKVLQKPDGLIPHYTENCPEFLEEEQRELCVKLRDGDLWTDFACYLNWEQNIDDSTIIGWYPRLDPKAKEPGIIPLESQEEATFGCEDISEQIEALGQKLVINNLRKELSETKEKLLEEKDKNNSLLDLIQTIEGTMNLLCNLGLISERDFKSARELVLSKKKKERGSCQDQ